MTVKYKVVARGNPSDPNAPQKYYPSIKSNGRTTLRDMAQDIAEISTVSSVDTMAMLEALLVVIPRELSKGNIVELGDLGSFWLRTRSEGADTAEDVTGRSITRALPYFKPGKLFKQVLQNITFEKAGE